MLDPDPALLIVTAVVIALALSANGLAALAAATSRRHWFVRTAAYLAGLSLLLVIPAPELVEMFALQGAVIAAGVTLWRRWRERRRRKRRARAAAEEDIGSPPAPRTAQFSLRSLLLITVLVGWAAAVGANTPPLNLRAWQSLLAIAVAGGLATLFGAAAATRRGWRAATWLLAAIAVAAVVAFPVANVDWLLGTMIGRYGWPPEIDLSTAAFLGVMPSWAELAPPWMSILPAVSLLAWCVIIPLRWLGAASQRGATQSWPRWIGRICAGILLAAMAAPLGYLWFKLAFPPPIPDVAMPDPNGWNELASACQAVGPQGQTVSAVTAEGASREQTKSGVEKVRDLLEQIRHAVRQPIRQPLSLVDDNFDSVNFIAVRDLMQLMTAQARVATWDGRYDDATEILLDTYRLGVNGRTGGLLVQGLVGVAVGGVARREIYDLRDSIPNARAAAVALLQQLNTREDFEEFAHREMLWSQHAHRWPGRLTSVLRHFLYGDSIYDSARSAFRAEAAETRLLALDLLALHFIAENGRPPATVEETIGDLPLADFTDPFDPAGQPLRAKPTDDSVLFYSVGYNGTDENGAAPELDGPWGWYSWNLPTGDLRLDLVCSDPPPEEQDGDYYDDSQFDEPVDDDWSDDE